MSILYKLKQNKSFNDVENVVQCVNFQKLIIEFQQLQKKYPLSIHYMSGKTFTKKERLERISKFLKK